MIEIAPELLDFLKIFNTDDGEFPHLIFDKNATPNVVPDGDYHSINDFNSGAMANTLEYERQLCYFIIDMLYMDRAVGRYLDILIGTWTNNSRPIGYTDQQYYDYFIHKTFSVKETPLALKALLNDYSSEDIIINEPGLASGVMFWGVSYYNQFLATEDDGGNLVPPALYSGDSRDNSHVYNFKIKLQPISEVAEKIIVDLLFVGHVSGVSYEIEYYSVPAWH